MNIAGCTLTFEIEAMSQEPEVRIQDLSCTPRRLGYLSPKHLSWHLACTFSPFLCFHEYRRMHLQFLRLKPGGRSQKLESKTSPVRPPGWDI